MSRYDILCGRAPVAKPAEVEKIRVYRALVLGGLERFFGGNSLGLTAAGPMMKYAGKEITVKKYIGDEFDGFLPGKSEAFWFQEVEGGYLRSKGSTKGKRGWLYHESWLKFLE